MGVKNVKETCLSIENSINDNIDPIPTYTLDVNEKTKVIRRIGEAYKDYQVKPQYKVTDNTIKVVLSVLTKSEKEHEERCRKLLKNVEDKLVFSRHPRDYFQLKAENY